MSGTAAVSTVSWRSVITISLVIFMVGMVVLFVSAHNRRAVIDFYASPQASAVDASCGEIASVTMVVEKRRSECTIMPTTMRFGMEDGCGWHAINQRTAVQEDVPLGRNEIPIRFEVPRMACPGPATVTTSASFQCELPFGQTAIVRHASRPMPLTIQPETCEDGA